MAERVVMRKGLDRIFFGWLWIMVPVLWNAVELRAQTGLVPAADAHVSLYVSMRAKSEDSLRELKPVDLAITDAGRPVDSREVHLSFAPPDRPPLVTFLFDHLRASDAKAASRSAVEMLNTSGGRSIPAGVLWSVWAIDTQLRVTQPYTEDTTTVRKALLALSANAAHPPGAGDPTPQTDLAGKSLEMAAQIVSERRAPWSYAAMLAAARTQRTRTGRKAIVLFTEETTFDVNAPDRFRELRQALRDAHISLYVVDVNALDAGESQQLMASSAMGGQATSNYYTGLANMHSTAPLATTMGMGAMGFQAMKDAITNIEMGVGQQDGNPLAQAALASGGLYSFGEVNAKKLGQRIMADVASYVTVSYTIPADQQDGRFHSVTIKPIKPRVSVVAQPGYYAAVGADEMGGALLRRTVDGTLEGDPALLERDAAEAELPLRAAVFRFGASSTGLRTAIAVEVPVSGLRLQEDEHTKLVSAHATVSAELTDAAGKTVARFQEEFRRRGAIETEKGLSEDALTFARPLSLPFGTYTLRCTVRDWNAGTWSRHVRPVEISGADGAISLSDLLLVRGTQPLPSNAEDAALQYGDKRVVPNLSQALGADDEKVSLYFQLYTAPAGSGPRSLTMVVSKDGKQIANLPLRTGEAQIDGLSTHLFTVPLSRGAGQYEMVVRLQQGKEVVERRVSAIVAESPTASNVADTREMTVEAGMPTAASESLSPAQSAPLLEAARENALAYTERLPNFLCLETIARAADHGGTGAWKMQDTLVESLQYRDKVEQRTVVRVNGEKSSLAADHVEGARSNGEFGSLLHAIFEPAAKAEFVWIKTVELKGERLEVFRFRVVREQSQFMVTDHTNSMLRAAFHGFVFIDNATRTVRRLSMQTEGLPRDFGVRSSWITMNYDYVTINDHDYLLPSHGEIGLQQGKHEVLLNELSFAGYRRFGARSRIMAAGAEAQP